MARVTITQENKDRSKIVPPAKYPIECIECREDQAGTDGSALYVYEFKIIDGAYKGVLLRYQVSEKAEGMGYELWEAMGADMTTGKSLDPLAFKGKRCVGFVQRGEYKGRPKNELVSFEKLTGAAAEAAAIPVAK